MLLDDMWDLLASVGGAGVGTTGTMFRGFLPEKPDAAVALYETGGFAPIRAMTGSAGQVTAERPRVQIVARATEYDYQTARTRMANAYAVLEGLMDRTVNGTRYLYAASVNSPFAMGRDAQGRVLIGCNFDVMKALSTSTST